MTTKAVSHKFFLIVITSIALTLTACGDIDDSSHATGPSDTTDTAVPGAATGAAGSSTAVLPQQSPKITPQDDPTISGKQVKSAPPAGSYIMIEASATSVTRGQNITITYTAKNLDSKESVTITPKSLDKYVSFTNPVSNSTTSSSNCTVTSAVPTCAITVNVSTADDNTSFTINSTTTGSTKPYTISPLQITINTTTPAP